MVAWFWAAVDPDSGVLVLYILSVVESVWISSQLLYLLSKTIVCYWAWGIKKYQQEGTIREETYLHILSSRRFSSEARICQRNKASPRSIQPVDLWYPHSDACCKLHIPNVEKHLVLNKGYPLDGGSAFAPVHALYLLIGTKTIHPWINSEFPSCHSWTNRMFVCSYDGLFTSLAPCCPDWN